MREGSLCSDCNRAFRKVELRRFRHKLWLCPRCFYYRTGAWILNEVNKKDG